MLTLVSGCGNVSTTGEQADVGKQTSQYEPDALVNFLVKVKCENADVNRVLEQVKDFVSNGADVNAKNRHGTTPLHGAVEIGQIKIVEFLVAKGANVNAKGLDDLTPLHLAATRNIEVVELLVSNGADVNAKAEGGSTPLHWATRNLEIVKFLVSKGADVSAKTEEGETPLDIAKEGKNNTEVVEYLSGLNLK